MYAVALSLSAATTAGTVGIPFFQLGSLNVGIPIQAFGVIVAVGVLIGAGLLRRYGEWHGVSDDHIRGLTGWITITGFLGAHWLDVLAYEPQKLSESVAAWPPSQWPVLIRVWDGISSYGGFVGGAIGFAIFVWWKRLPARLMADIAIVGLLPAFSIGRIGCTVVSDHIGAAVDPSKWYAALAMDYPRNLNMTVVQNLVSQIPQTGNTTVDYVTRHFIPLPAWNLGLIELLYLIPVNALILWLAFRPNKRMPAGFLIVLAGVLYAPVRFFLDYLRPENSDPRHLGLTFAQWASLAAFGACVYVAAQLLKNGKPAEPVTTTSREAQERLRVILKDDDDDEPKPATVAAKPRPPSEPAAEPEAEPTAKPLVATTEPSTAEPRQPAKPSQQAKPSQPARPAGAKPGQGKAGGARKNKKQ
ncbi:MAG: prolipoprotein diacylglyceryl transferase [Deltaproteobacteria bacterium]|nr:prolipoprotein diacylglyceryl transferase [Deltaproteobacteria bacterium]